VSGLKDEKLIKKQTYMKRLNTGNDNDMHLFTPNIITTEVWILFPSELSHCHTFSMLYKH